MKKEHTYTIKIDYWNGIGEGSDWSQGQNIFIIPNEETVSRMQSYLNTQLISNGGKFLSTAEVKNIDLCTDEIKEEANNSDDEPSIPLDARRGNLIINFTSPYEYLWPESPKDEGDINLRVPLFEDNGEKIMEEMDGHSFESPTCIFNELIKVCIENESPIKDSVIHKFGCGSMDNPLKIIFYNPGITFKDDTIQDLKDALYGECDLIDNSYEYVRDSEILIVNGGYYDWTHTEWFDAENDNI